MTKNKLYFDFILGIGILFIFTGPYAWWVNLIIAMAVALCFLVLPFFIIMQRLPELELQERLKEMHGIVGRR